MESELGTDDHVFRAKLNNFHECVDLLCERLIHAGERTMLAEITATRDLVVAGLYRQAENELKSATIGCDRFDTWKGAMQFWTAHESTEDRRRRLALNETVGRLVKAIINLRLYDAYKFDRPLVSTDSCDIEKAINVQLAKFEERTRPLPLLDVTLRFTVAADVPYYHDWDFRIYPGIFDLHIPELLRRLHDEIDTCELPANRTANGPRHERYKQIRALADWLTEKAEQASGTVEAAPSFHHLICGIAGSAIFGRHFDSVVCPECQSMYRPHQCSTKLWSYGSGLGAIAGGRLICPQEHTLYLGMIWLS
jgi:hypothetical protein